MRFTLVIFFVFTLCVAGQTYELTGVVKDSVTKQTLSYANVRVAGTMRGTSANEDGRFSIKLRKGNHTIIVSYLGYASDTLKINIAADMFVEIELKEISLELPAVTVLPGKNPALPIIAEAIAYKHKRDTLLNSYIYKAYTKALIRSPEKISASGNTVSIGLGSDDSTQMSITGIIENESRGYYKKPDRLKEEIIARKQTANAPSTINILTGGRLIQNFYGDDIYFLGKNLPSPIADEAVDYYYYYLEDSLALDNKKVYKIYFNVIDDANPGFYGYVFIADGLFNLYKIDAHINSAANPGGIFSDVSVFQQFLSYGNNIFMPIDYRVKAEGNIYGLVKFGVELNSVFYDYEINPIINDEFFDKAILTVLPDADERDSLYWKNVQSIPSTLEEVKAYAKFDSISNAPKSLFENFSPFAFQFKVGDNFWVDGPLSLYKFNRVEGHALNFNVRWYNFFKRRFSGSAGVGYGFNDAKFKWSARAKYLLGDYRTFRFGISAYEKLAVLFQDYDYYNEFTSTFLNLVSKYDFRSYFYSKGFEADFYGEVLPVLFAGIKYENRSDLNGFINSDFSFFNKNKTYPLNVPIDEGNTSILTFSVDFDFRDYIEDGYYRRRVSRSGNFILFGGDISFGKFGGVRGNDFTKYHGKINGSLSTFGSSLLRFNAHAYWSEGIVPFQHLTSLPGNIKSSGKSYSFRTLGFGEVYGDRAFTLFVEENFGDELFRKLGIPLLDKSQLNLSVYFSGAISTASTPLKKAEPSRNYIEFKSPFYEAGFSLGHPLFPLKFEFTWKLNYRGRNDFVFGVNSAIL